MNEDLHNFVFTASHQYRRLAPGAGGAAARSQPAAQVPVIFDMIQGSADCVQRTIEHLTAVIKVQKCEPQAPAPVDGLAVIIGVRLDLAPELWAAGGHLEMGVTDCQPLPFAKKKLRSVVYNLLSNAIKYRGPARSLHVHLSCHTVGGEVPAVRDNGLGLANEPCLFARF